MSKHFIESKHNSISLQKAVRQQEQLLYFTESNIQEDVTTAYLEQWANRKYRTNNHFLNFLKSILKTENFLLIYKYLRHPLPSSSLINDKIKTPLKRVFFSEDPYFKYEINGEIIKNPSFLNIEEFNDLVFNGLLFRHNDIMIADLDDVNSPFRELISIKNVIALDSHNSVINRIAYSAMIEIEGEIIKGILYIDKENYIFYQKDLDKILLIEPHDLGRCPADYISSEAFTESDVIRKSIFTSARETMEEYVFLKTLQRMVEAKSVIPTITILDTDIESGEKDVKGADGEPMSLRSISGQKSSQTSDLDGGVNVMSSGNIIKVPLERNNDGKIDMDVVTNYINFFYIPIESVNYLNTRVKEVKALIISNILGDFSESSIPQGSKSDLEAGINIVSRQDKLRDLAKQISRIRQRSDYNLLSLKYGKENISNQAFYGSDFFLESQEKIYELIKNAPNQIEQKSLLIKSARNRNRFNQDGFMRDFILYHLIPYGNIEDFDRAVNNNRIGDITFQYQTRFNYWIGLFETEHGDILTFWNMFDEAEVEKIRIINDLITIIIKDNYEKSSMVENLSRTGNS